MFELLLFPLALALAPRNDPTFVEVAPLVGLSFTTTISTGIPGLDATQDIIQRTLGHGAAVGDYDADGDLDVYVLGSYGQANALFRNELDLGAATYTDVTAISGRGLADDGDSRVAHFVDLDDDGDLDLLWVNDQRDATPTGHVMRNDGNGAFTDVSLIAGFSPIGFAHPGLSLADYDRDGLLDLHVSNWSYELGLGGSSGFPAFPGSNRVFRNLGSLTFDDATTACGLDGIQRDAFTAIFTDFDGDLWPDLYVAFDHTSDEMWRNQGGQFVNITSEVGCGHIGNDMGATAADFDDDGDLDLYITNITDSLPLCGFGTGRFNVLWENAPNREGAMTFVDRAQATGTEDTYWGWGVEFTDVENDGDLDLLAVNGFDPFIELLTPSPCSMLDQPPVLLENDGTGQFQRFFASGLDLGDDSRCLVAFDYDRDGDQDYLVTNVGEPVRLYENITPNTGHWLDVRVTQRPGLNSRGIGAVVYATVGSQTMRREILAGKSYLAGTPAEVHFGLASATQVDELRVVWTDGTTTVMTNVAADRMLHVVQP